VSLGGLAIFYDDSGEGEVGSELTDLWL
jgi:hypothetical protein